MEEKPNEEIAEEVNVNETKAEEEKTIDTGFKKVQQKKKTNFGKLFFVIILLAGITAGVWYFVYYQPSQNQNNNQVQNNNQESNVDNNEDVIKIDEAKNWEKTYSKILTDENNYKNYNTIQMQLIKLNRYDQIPVMVVTYESTRNPFEKVLDVWKTDENGTSIEKVDNCSTTDDSLKILYDVKEGIYKWYIYNRTSETEAYGDLSRLLDNTRNTTSSIDSNIFNLSKMGSFNFYDYVVSSNPLMGNINKEEFEEKYIVVNTKDLKDTWVELKINEIDENEVLKAIIIEEKLNKSASSVVSDIKDSIFAQADEILKKSEQKNSNQNNANNTTENNVNANTENQAQPNQDPIQTLPTPVVPDNSNNNQNNQNAQNNQANNPINDQPGATDIVQPENTDIGQQEALNIAKKIFGDESEGRKMSYTYLAWVNDTNGKKYYAFRVAWLVNNDHYSFVDTLLISADGKLYKEIGTPENFVDGQTVTKFDVEGNV